MKLPKMLPIDGMKLKKIIKNDLKLDLKDVSETLGYEKSFLSGVISENKINKSSVIILDKLYGISYDSYKVKEDDVIDEDNMQKLMADIRVLVYDTVKQAVKDAFNE